MFHLISILRCKRSCCWRRLAEPYVLLVTGALTRAMVNFENTANINLYLFNAGLTIDYIFKSADQEMYREKFAEGNRYYIAEEAC